jgi:hypothetical protein
VIASLSAVAISHRSRTPILVYLLFSLPFHVPLTPLLLRLSPTPMLTPFYSHPPPTTPTATPFPNPMPLPSGYAHRTNGRVAVKDKALADELWVRDWVVAWTWFCVESG